MASLLICLGPTGRPPQTLQRYAEQVGLVVEEIHREDRQTQRLGLYSLGLRGASRTRSVLMRDNQVWTTDPRAATQPSDHGHWLSVSIKPVEPIIEIVVPHTAVEQVFYSLEGEELLISTDQRLLLAATDHAVDPRGVYCLFQYGAVQAPYTVAARVRRLPPGYRCSVGAGGAFSCTSIPLDDDSDLSVGIPTSPEDQVQEHIFSRLKESLGRLPTHRKTIVLFSGGVDSSLLAAAVKETGLDAVLLNMSFGPDDSESLVAESIAKHLEMPFRRCFFDPSTADRLLSDFANEYLVPFADTSVIPTNSLIHTAIDLFGSDINIVDGTGADGCFGMQKKARQWMDIYRVPYTFRWLVGQAYKIGRFWTRSGRLEYLARLLRRSVQMEPLLAGVAAQNPLDGVAYRFPTDVSQHVKQVIGEQPKAFLRGQLNAATSFTLLDVMHVGANMYAQKTFSPATLQGADVIYPFLDPRMLALAAAFCRSGDMPPVPKQHLKRLLQRHLPSELIYRPKSGFTAPKTLFQQASFRAKLRNLLQHGYAEPFLDQSVLDGLLEKLENGGRIGEQGYRFLWTLLVFEQWVQSIWGPARRGDR